MYLIAQFILFFVSLYILLVCRIITKISFKKDYLLYIIFGLFYIYLFIVPIYNQILDNTLNEQLYFQILLYIILFFQIPFLIFYVYKNKKIDNRGKELRRKRKSEFIYSGFCLLLAAAFYVIAIPNSLFYLRDSVYNPELRYNISFWQFLIYRSYIEYAPVIILLSTYLLLKFKWKEYPFFFKFSFLFFTVSYLVFVLLNSRLSLLLLSMQVTGLFLIYGIKLRYSKKTYILAALGFLFVLYSYNVILNIRSNMSSEGFQLSYFNPFHFKIDQDAASEPINTRLDGVYLMAEMTPSAKEKGYAMGKAWGVPLFLSIAPVLFPQQALAIKSSYLTDSESYLLITYTNLSNSTMDFNSVLLTDLYCNFSFWGFLIGAYFIGLVILYSKRNMIKPKGKSSLILAFFLYTKIMIFESESIAIPLKLFKFLPLLFILIWIFPITSKVELSYDNNDNNSHL